MALRPNPWAWLAGRRVAILAHQRPNFRRLATLAAESLRAEHGGGEPMHFDKPNAAIGARPETLDEIARTADLVLTGSAD